MVSSDFSHWIRITHWNCEFAIKVPYSFPIYSLPVVSMSANIGISSLVAFQWFEQPGAVSCPWVHLFSSVVAEQMERRILSLDIFTSFVA